MIASTPPILYTEVSSMKAPKLSTNVTEIIQDGTPMPGTALYSSSASGWGNNMTEHADDLLLDTETSSKEEPSQAELAQLDHVADPIPRGVWLVACIVASERFVYFGLTTPLQNYMQNAPENVLRPGALGLGQAKATSLWYFFSCWMFITPTLGAMAADGWLGRYKTLLVASGFYVTGALILFFTSLPNSLHHGAGLGGLVTAMVFLGTGVGAFKSCSSAFIAEQYTEKTCRLKTLSNGDRVILDPKVTLQSIYSMYFWCVNAGSFSVVAATFLEKNIGFWAAFLLPLCMLSGGVILLLLGRKLFVMRHPDGTILSKTFRALGYGALGGFDMEKAKPDALVARGKVIPWDEQFITDVKSTLAACRVFLPFPILCLCQAQISSNLVSMAADMETHGFPNDLMMILNPVSILLVLPLVDRLLYPYLRRKSINFEPISRMIFGFLMESLAMTCAAIVQHAVYSSGPCYSYPRACPSSLGGSLPNHINVFAQVPIYFTEGFGEIFCSAAGYEYAFTKAPASMKSLVQAVFISTAAVGTAIGWVLTPLYDDPRLVIMYSILAGLMASAMILSAAFLRNNGRTEPMTTEMQTIDEIPGVED